MGILSKLLDLFSQGNGANKHGTNNIISFEVQLKTFNQLGFTFNPGVETDDLNRFPDGYQAFEEQPYALMYAVLGQTIEREPWTPITNKCWNLDTEVIEDHGAYVEIVENISRVTNGELVLENIEDYVDIEEKVAWVSFSCKGDAYKWDLKVDDDWADGALFEKMQDLASKYKTNRKFTYFDTGGQDFVLGFSTPDELEKIRKATGLEIVWF